MSPESVVGVPGFINVPSSVSVPAPAALEAVPHDFHVSYGHLAVEGNVAVLRIRFFRDDLKETLGHFAASEGGGVHSGAAAESESQRPSDSVGDTSFQMQADPSVDALFLKYFTRHFRLRVGDSGLTGRIIGSGEDEVDREPVWWYLIHFEAPTPITAMRIRNVLMFDRYADQKNVLKAVHFPDQTQRTYYFAAGEEEFEVEF